MTTISKAQNLNHRIDVRQKFLCSMIKIIRKSLKLSQKEFAEKVDVSYRHYQDIESGKSDIKLKTFLKICELTGVTCLAEDCFLEEQKLNPLLATHEINFNCTAKDFYRNVDDYLNTFSGFRHSIEAVDSNGKIIFINQSYENISGYAKKDLVEKKFYWENIVPKSNRKHAEQYFSFLKNEQPPSVPFETQFRRSDGITLPIISHWKYLRGKNSEFFGIIRFICMRL